jgi:hypothetical protein
LVVAATAVLLVLAIPDPALAASGNFIEADTSPESLGGTGPIGIVGADLDGDTDIDLAVATSNVDSVSILKNNGLGDYTFFTSVPVGDNPTALVAADFDGDLDADLAAINSLDGTVTVLRNNGNGNFVEFASSPETVGPTPRAIAAADFDGDLDIDLAVGNANGSSVTILRNRGTGNFVEPASSPEPAGVGPAALAATDLDGDTDIDLAVVNLNVGTVTILKNNGNGNFNKPSSSPAVTGLNVPNGIAAADLDGDTDIDLAVSAQNGNNVTILRNRGKGSFFQESTSPEAAGHSPTDVVAGDFDKDGDVDLAVPNNEDDNVTILKNRGNGNFFEPSTSPEKAGDRPVRIAVADLDGDTDVDLAVTNIQTADVTILKNR